VLDMTDDVYFEILSPHVVRFTMFGF